MGMMIVRNRKNFVQSQVYIVLMSVIYIRHGRNGVRRPVMHAHQAVVLEKVVLNHVNLQEVVQQTPVRQEAVDNVSLARTLVPLGMVGYISSTIVVNVEEMREILIVQRVNVNAETRKDR